MPADALPRQFLLAFATVVAACIGSFLNVVIARVPHGRSIVRPGSACPRCGASIRWYDNVPVISWILLGARCRACKAPISARYPLVELLVAAAGWLAASRHGASVAALVEFTAVTLLVALAFIDLDTWLLPHVLTIPLAVLGLLASAAGLTPARTLAAAASGAALGAGFFWLVSVVGTRLAKREAMGFGDVVLMGALGAYLGARAVPPLVLLSSVQGSLVGIALLLLGRGQPGPDPGGAGDRPHSAEPGGEAGASDDFVPPRHAVPFGPFLALAAVEWLYLAPWLAAHVPGLDLFVD